MKSHRTSKAGFIFKLCGAIMLAAILCLPTSQPALARPQALGVNLYVAPTGSDDVSNACTDPGSPCLTIQHAVDIAAAGDILNVAEGTYTSTATEVVLINKDISLLGGWDTGFTVQDGTSTINGETVRRGVTIQSGTVTIDHFTVQNGYYISQGGGIWNAGTLTLAYSTIKDNQVRSSGYTSPEGGAGLRNLAGTVIINNSTFTGNRVQYGYGSGSAILSEGTVTLNNSTVSGNLPTTALRVLSGTMHITSSTIAFNNGGVSADPGTSVILRNSIVAVNQAINPGGDCGGTITSEGYNLIGHLYSCVLSSAPGDLIGDSQTIDPKLGPLTDNGGPTQTHALAATSPALNAGSPETPGGGAPTACPAADQRGVPRGSAPDDPCDIGAYEGFNPMATRYVAPTGDDAETNSCTDPGSPCLTISAAVNRATADDIIKVAEGTYTGSSYSAVLLNKSLTLQGGWDSGFTAQSGTTIIDGQDARRGIEVRAGFVVVLEHFTITNGYSDYGAGIYNSGHLTINNCILTDNWATSRGGAVNAGPGTTIINESILSNNKAGQSSVSGAEGGAIFGAWTSGTGVPAIVVVNSSSITGNSLLGFSSIQGSAISNHAASFTLNNTTISGNTSAAAISPATYIIINNSTITDNPMGGIRVPSGRALMTNSILARNTSGGGADCAGTIISGGYNLLGSTSTYCGFRATNTDLVGTSESPIDPHLLPLNDNGGPTPTHALADISPALNAGSPALPGGPDLSACLPTDQRGVNRDADRCDIGAFEGSYTVVTSIARVQPSPTSSSSLDFTVTFSQPVTGVDMTAPFDQFALNTTGVTGASIQEITGSDATYNVKVFTGTGNGTIGLDLVDDDLIMNGAGLPLGGSGLGNGDFTGKVYTLTRIPKTIIPNTGIWDFTPKFQWSAVPDATRYSFQVFRGTTRVYTKTVSAAACINGICTNTPGTFLPGAVYKWRVRAETEGSWKAYSPFRAFTVLRAKAGRWEGNLPIFYVNSDGTKILNYMVFVSCGTKVVPVTYPSVSIIGNKFSFTGSFMANGTFSSQTKVGGFVKLTSHWVSGCNAKVSTYRTWWSAVWHSISQPGITLDPEPSVQFVPGAVQVIPAEIISSPEDITP